MTPASASARGWRRFDAWPRPLFAAVVAAFALVVGGFFFPPRVEAWARRNPRLQEWSRADSFLRQCEDPWRQDVEPAVRWRLLPPLVCHALGLEGTAPVGFCWTGLAALFIALAARLDRWTGRRDLAVLGTVAFATTGPAITAMGWLGLNDGWCLLALLETAAGRSAWALAGWALAGPWIDERYLIGLPLAFFARSRLAAAAAGGAAAKDEAAEFDPDRAKRSRRQWIAVLVGLAPYILIRGGCSLLRRDPVSGQYLDAMIEVFKFYAAFVPVGWAMGYRCLWIALAVGLWAGKGETANRGWIGARSKAGGRSEPWAAVGIALTAATLMVISVLAWDLDRSTGIALPLFFLVLVLASRSERTALGAASGGAVPDGESGRETAGEHGRGNRWRVRTVLGLCVLANLLLPYAHVVGPTLTWNRGPLGLWTALTH